MAGSFSWGGTDLADYGVYLKREWPFDLIPEVREHLIVIPGRDGAYDYDPELGPRYFPLECTIKADSRALLVTNLLALETVLNPKFGTQKLKFDSIGADIYWNARPTGITRIKFTGKAEAELTITFIAPDPATQSEGS